MADNLQKHKNIYYKIGKYVAEIHKVTEIFRGKILEKLKRLWNLHLFRL